MHGNSSSRRRRKSAGTGTIALSLGLCLCAGQLISTPPASAAAAPAAAPIVKVAAAKQAKQKISIRTTVSTRTLKYGSKVKVTAKYINPTNGKVVTAGSVRLQAYRNGKWLNWSSKGLNSSGTVSFSAEPHMSGYFRTYYTGSSAYSAHTGAKIKVNVVRTSAGTKILNEAKRHTGSLYKFGASGPTRFDCSGFTKYVYKKTTGKNLPHKANSQQKAGKAVSKSNKKVGDLIVFRNGSYGYHAGIYAGNGYIYDSPHTGARVGKHKMFSSNYVVRRLAA